MTILKLTGEVILQKYYQNTNFFFYHLFIYICIFSSLQHGDPLTHTYIYSFFSNVFHHKWLDRVPSATQNDPIADIPKATFCIFHCLGSLNLYFQLYFYVSVNEKLHIFKIYNLMNFDLCLHPWNHNPSPQSS